MKHEHRFRKSDVWGDYVCECGAIRRFKKAPQLEEPTVTVFHREYFSADEDTRDSDRRISSTFYDTEPERGHAQRVNDKHAVRMIWDL